jgi:TolA-binding protein
MCKFQKNNSIIKFRCLIIITIFSVLAISCSTPRSVRPTSPYQASNRTVIRRPYIPEDEKNNEKSKDKKQEVTKNESPKKDELTGSNDAKNKNTQDNIPAQSNPIAGLSDNKTKGNDEFNNQTMPSLVEQLRSLNSGQMDIQQDLRDIKSSISDIETRLGNLEKNKTPIDNEKMLAQNDPKPIKKKNLILPDESISKNEPKKPVSFKSKISKNHPTNQVAAKEVPKEEPKEVSKTNNVKEEPPAINAKDKTSQIDEVKKTISQKDYGEAIRKLTKMVNELKDPVTVNICNFYLGESNFGLKQYDKAIDFYQKVLNYGNSDKNDDSQIMIAEAKFRMGNLSEAKNAFAKFLKTYPKSEHTPEARKMLQQL